MTRRRLLAGLFLLVYAVAVLAITVIPRPAPHWPGEPPWPTMIHWVPLAVDADSGLANILMFVPFGLLVPMLWPGLRSAARLGWTALAASLSIELVQLLFLITVNSRRTVDVNDLISNTLGALIGLWLYRHATRRTPAQSASH